MQGVLKSAPAQDLSHVQNSSYLDSPYLRLTINDDLDGMDQKVNSIQEENHRYGVILGGIGVELGSLLHLFHVPLRGRLLSINQGLVLSYALRKNRNKQGPFISSNLLVFAYYAERDHSKMIWIALRPLAVGFLLFYFARSSWGQSFFRKARGAHG